MSKNYQLTLNQVKKWESLKEYLTSLKNLSYIIAGKEKAPTTGHEHIHIYVQFKVSTRLSQNKLQGAHIEVCKASPQKNVEYCKKEGNIIFEQGTLRKTGRLSIQDTKKMKEEELENLPLVYYNTIQNIKRDKESVINVQEYYKECYVYFIYGPSGAGKTHFAVNKIKELVTEKKVTLGNFNEVKYTNGFWQGISQDYMSEIALYDDFRDYHIPASEFINFIDYNVHIMNIKYGNVKNKFKYIFITSIQNPEDLYLNSQPKEPKEQWLRRITEIIYLYPQSDEY